MILVYLAKAVGTVVGAFSVYLFFIAVLPGISIPEQPLERTSRPVREKDARRVGSRKDVSFEVKGTSLSAWLYLPENRSTPVPCIVMGSGGGGTKDMGMEPYALRFLEAGFAALLFDYRYFGESGGEPRQLLWIPYQLEDYSAAIAYARGLEEIDPAKIALWGTSASGGHVIVLAARDARIAGVVAQCPGLDGMASGKMLMKGVGVGYMLRMVMHGQRDMVRSWLGLSPHKIPIVGRPGSIALLTTPDGYDGFRRLAPEGFVNEVCARVILRASKYRPVKHAENVRCPVLLQICDNDSFTPASAAEETAERLGKLAEVIHYPIGHFDIYHGSHFERSVSDQLAFFRKHLDRSAS